MSGYGGQPPAWNNDPYGQGPAGQGPYGQGPAGQGPYGQQPYRQGQGSSDPNGPGTQPGWDPQGQYQPPFPGYGYGPPGVPQAGGRDTPGSTIAALICACVATAMCCNLLAIPAIVTSVLAMNRSRTDPSSCRNLTMWTWVILGVSLALQIILFAVLIILDASSTPTYDEYGSDGI